MRNLGLLTTMVFLIFCVTLSAKSQTVEAKKRSIKKTLAHPMDIQGIFCSGDVFFYETGELSLCELARDDTISNHALPAGTVVQFRTDRTMEWCFLSKDAKLQGHVCRGSGRGGWQTAFHSNGILKVVWLAQDEEIQGVTCQKASFWSDVFGGGVGVAFHDNGRLAKCKLAKAVTIENIAFKKGDQIKFDRNGQLIKSD